MNFRKKVNNLKQEILNELKKNMNCYISGEELSKKFNVSRTAIMKNIRAIIAEGYQIESSTKKGYCLIQGQDVLNRFEIGEVLDTNFIGKKIIYLDSVDSTNNYAKSIASNSEDGAVVVAGEQTEGRGRLGRKWCSQAGKGAWMSIILKPDVTPERIQIITLAAAVATAKAIDNLYGIKTGIKWPNDLILNKRKVCGILTEMNCETDRINYVVVGIGVNVNQDAEDFTKDLREIATSLKISGANNIEKKFQRSDIIKGILVEFEKLHDEIKRDKIENSDKINNADKIGSSNKIERSDESLIINEWKKYSVTLGQEVRVTAGNASYTAIAKDITDEGKLVVETADGKRKVVSSGEVSVKNLMGY